MSSSSTITEAHVKGEGLGRGAHPGEVLAGLYLDELSLSASDLAEAIGLSSQTVQDVLDAKAPVDADMALRLEKAFGTKPSFWLRMQADFDLEQAQRDHDAFVDTIQPLHAAE